MHLSGIKLFNFKNYETAALAFSERLNCFTGLNGMGKTNILDAVHFLCLCKGHGSLPDKHLVRHGESFFRLDGVFVPDDSDKEQIVAKVVLGRPKVFERNGTAYERLGDYVGRFPAVMIAPDDVALVQEGSEDRRRFLDTTLSQLSQTYLWDLMRYNALLKQRNALLKHFGETKRFDAALLEAIDQQLPAPAQRIFERRKAFVADFAPVFAECYRDIANGREQVEVVYDADLSQHNLADLLRQLLDKDLLLQRTTAGPHRDDLILNMDGHPVKKFASQGQLKSFLLALRLAQYEMLRREKGSAPILLLDDIFDKLDEQRVRHLVGLLLRRNFGQIFITDTQRTRLEGIVASFTGDYRMFEVVEGQVVAG